MLNESFMFTVGMLAEITGGNKQYISKKIKKMMDNPEVSLRAVLKSNKEGYQIPEEEVLRCFDKITPGMLQEYKANYLAAEPVPRVKMLTRDEDGAEPKYLEKENEALLEWKVQLAAASPEKKNSPQMRSYLMQEIEKIEKMKKEKLKEYVMLEMFLENCDRMTAEIRRRLGTGQETAGDMDGRGQQKAENG